MGKIANIAGQRFGRLIAVRPLGLDKNHKMQWACTCDCGGTTITYVRTLRSGLSQSCGCLQKERASTANKIHGEGNARHLMSPEYRTWSAMLRDRKSVV